MQTRVYPPGACDRALYVPDVRDVKECTPPSLNVKYFYRPPQQVGNRRRIPPATVGCQDLASIEFIGDALQAGDPVQVRCWRRVQRPLLLGAQYLWHYRCALAALAPGSGCRV
jgi:hypothetical protein